MGDELSFLHPAQDPSEERTSRAHTKVGRTVRLRRNRRRALVSVPLVAMVAAVAISAASPQGGEGDRQEVASGGPDAGSATKLSVDPNTVWGEAILSKDGRTIRILVESTDGTGRCEQRHSFVYDVVETAESVTIGFEDTDRTTSAGCPRQVSVAEFEARLDEPLGDRKVYDGVQPGSRIVHRQEVLVDVTHMPDGFTATDPDPLDLSGERWQQVFRRDDADWWFIVTQEPATSAASPQGTPAPVMVKGIEGHLYTGQVKNPVETIRWIEGDLMISVSASVVEAPPATIPAFTHHDELVRIAEGVQLPD